MPPKAWTIALASALDQKPEAEKPMEAGSFDSKAFSSYYHLLNLYDLMSDPQQFSYVRVSRKGALYDPILKRHVRPKEIGEAAQSTREGQEQSRPPSGARMVPPSVWLDETGRQIRYLGLTQDDSQDRGG